MITQPGNNILKTDPAVLQQAYLYCPVPVLMVSLLGIITWANAAEQEQSGFGDARLIGSAFFDLYQDASHSRHNKNRLLGGEELLDADFWARGEEGEQRYIQLNSKVYQDDLGQVYSLLFVKDITPLKKQENLLNYLNKAAEELARARDTNSALDKISKLIVPHFAGWFTIDILKDDKVEQLILAYDDPGHSHWAENYRRNYPLGMDSARSIVKVIKSGIPSLISRMTPEMIRQVVAEPDRVEAVEHMGLQSSITVPMFSQGAISGALKFISTTPGRYYDETDLRFAQNLAGHISLALENTRLNEAAVHEIGRRRLIEDKLTVTQTQLQSTLSSGLVGTWLLDLENNILYPDETLSLMFGIEHSPDGCDRELFARLVHPDDRQLIDTQQEESAAKDSFYETEYRVLVNGAVRWFFARGRTDLNADGKPLLFSGVIVDITQRKEAQLALIESEERYSVAFQNASVGILLSNLDGKLIKANSAFTRITGYTEEELLDKDFRAITHTLDLERNVELYRQLFSQEIPDFVFEKRYFHKNGHIIWVRNSTSMVRDAQGNPAYTISITEDITDQKRVENELRESEELFRFLSDAIPHKLWTSAPDGTATYYNKGWYDYTGAQNFDELKSRIWDIIHPIDRVEAAKIWPRAIQNGKEATLEHRFLRSDGQYRWHLSRFIPHKDDEGNIIVWVGTSTDIHEQKSVQEALMNSEAHFKALTQLNSLPIWQVNAQCESVFVNDTWRAFTGVTSEDINEADWAGNIHPDDRDEALKQFNELFALRQSVHLKYRFMHAPSGEYRWMLDNAQPVFNPEFYGYIGTMTDIHEQEQASLAIQQLMGKKDEFISIASHELKTPLTTIKVFFQLMQREIGKDHRLSNLSVKADRQLLRLERLIEELLDVSRINAGKMRYQLEDFNFREALTDAVESVQEISPKHQLIIETNNDLHCCADRYRIEQVIINLLSNAVKYSPEADKVLIRYREYNNRLEVAVQDFGIGIAVEDQEGLFSRFYRVDQAAHRFQGLGLGLFISDEIVRRHGSAIRVESIPDQGSIFVFDLPLAVKP